MGLPRALRRAMLCSGRAGLGTVRLGRTAVRVFASGMPVSVTRSEAYAPTFTSARCLEARYSWVVSVAHVKGWT